MTRLLDHLLLHCGRIVGYFIFGFLFASSILLPCVALGIYPRHGAMLEALSDGLWMAAGGLIVTMFSGEKDDA